MGIRPLWRRRGRARSTAFALRLEGLEARVMLRQDLGRLSLVPGFSDLGSAPIDAAPSRGIAESRLTGPAIVVTAGKGTTTADPQAAQVQAIYQTYLHQRPSKT